MDSEEKHKKDYHVVLLNDHEVRSIPYLVFFLQNGVCLHELLEADDNVVQPIHGLMLFLVFLIYKLAFFLIARGVQNSECVGLLLW